MKTCRLLHSENTLKAASITVTQGLLVKGASAGSRLATPMELLILKTDFADSADESLEYLLALLNTHVAWVHIQSAIAVSC